MGMNYQKIVKQAFDKIKFKKFDEAKKDLNRLIKKFPVNTDFLNALAFVETNLNDINNSVILLKKSISINKNQSETLRNLALNLIQKSEFEDAQHYTNIGLELYPEDNLFYFINGIIFSSLDNTKEAIKSYKDSLKINPNFTKAYLNLGFILNKSKDYLGAVEIYEKLLELEPNSHDANYNLAISYDNLGESDKAKLHYEEALKINPQNDVAKFNLSVLNLLLMNFSEGWKLYEWRWYGLDKPPFTKEISPCLELNKDQRILLWGEQGIGEQIIYTSMLCDLKGFKKLTVAINPRLIQIYQRSFKDIQFVERQKFYDKNAFDMQLALGDLGKFLRTSVDSFNKQQKKFLLADPEKVNYFKKKFKSQKKLLCGISWKSKNEKIGNDKSINLEELLPRLNTNKFNFVDLQYGDTNEEREKILLKYQIKIANEDELDKFNDLDSLLALIDACDVVITVSNVTAHLAGALGKKTFMLAPHVFGLIWHWHKGSESLWYPSINIIRKSTDNSWADPIKKLAITLDSLIN